MENQHRMITGYRDLPQEDIALINGWKALEHQIGQMLAKCPNNEPAALRWNAMARTYFETGFMYAIKAVALPSGGLGNTQGGSGTAREAPSSEGVQPVPHDLTRKE